MISTMSERQAAVWFFGVGIGSFVVGLSLVAYVSAWFILLVLFGGVGVAVAMAAGPFPKRIEGGDAQ